MIVAVWGLKKTAGMLELRGLIGARLDFDRLRKDFMTGPSRSSGSGLHDDIALLSRAEVLSYTMHEHTRAMLQECDKRFDYALVILGGECPEGID